MSCAEDSLALPRRPAVLATLARFFSSPRFLVYFGCTAVALLTSYHLGKDMAWDTLDYHFYAGFSALHDRLSQDYFPAGPQSYLNPYVYVPFYLLVTSGLTALQVASILAAVQSLILWLVYELALTVAPASKPRVGMALAVCAVALAYANPVLMNEIGSSFADVLTAELVIAGWLLLARAIRNPSWVRIACAGLLLGCASALKLTNALPAVSAGLLVLFVPGDWRSRLRHVTLFPLAGTVGFGVVAASWALRLEQHFGNPFFPLLNGFFRSPQFTTARVLDYRFIPLSLTDALWRPFAMVAPRAMIHVEWAAPDLRYAVVLVAAAVSLIWGWLRLHKKTGPTTAATRDGSTRVLVALGLALLVDWSLWLAASGNSRYFIPMGCVAAVVAIGLMFQLCAQSPKLRNYVLLAIFGVQFFQLYFGAQYPSRTPWTGESWFDVSVPHSLAAEPDLFFTMGIQTNSFLAAYLAPHSAMVNLVGSYTLGATGANGGHIKALIQSYSPHLRVLVRDIRDDASKDVGFPHPDSVNDALEPFGLELDSSRCARIVVHGITRPIISTTNGPNPPKLSLSEALTGYFVSCAVVPATTRDPAVTAGEGAANVALDHLEDSCPTLLQPRRPATYLLGDRKRGYIWVRQYSNSDMAVWVTRGWLHFQRLTGGKEGYAGPESAWEKAPLRTVCGRGGPEGYFLRVPDLH